MADTTIIGLSGSVTLPSGSSLKIFRATLRLSQRIIDITNTGSSGNMEVVGGLKSATGTVLGYPHYGTAASSPGWGAISATPASMVVTAATGCTYTFNALISGLELAIDYEGKTVVTGAFASSGAIVEVWATS